MTKQNKKSKNKKKERDKMIKEARKMKGTICKYCRRRKVNTVVDSFMPLMYKCGTCARKSAGNPYASVYDIDVFISIL